MGRSRSFFAPLFATCTLLCGFAMMNGSFAEEPARTPSQSGALSPEAAGDHLHRASGDITMDAKTDSGGTRVRAGINSPLVNKAVNHSIISGTGMGRPGMGIGTIGGATKNVTGAVSGTDFRPKHP